ncbi:hypothetical protein ACE1ET_00215 [Saccharicrinis sp. FJH62]|uniref:hypothetical protein n=1 Tax=Saccharicrinis sp. FJH62 TaxID=3344657 RepID=UPI0035D518E0
MKPDKQQRILLRQDYTVEELSSKIDQGARFIVFQYCVTVFFAVVLKRFSPAILIEDSKEMDHFRRKYNLLSGIFGWWGIPWGPFWSMASVRINREGGFDLTDDIMLNITEEGLIKREVDYVKTQNLYIKPDKWDIKSIRKAFERPFRRDVIVNEIYAGLYINVEEDENPYLVIGLSVKRDFERYKERALEALYTEFRKFARFDFVDLDDGSNLSTFLKSQGERIK